jgi:glutamate racemase
VDERPIGVFDSGFGGLSVARALIDLLPGERIVYVGDTGRYPYGPRPAEEIRSFSVEIAQHLVDQADVKMIVVACNTAASVALDVLRHNCHVPVVGVIEPGLRAALRVTRSGRVGVIGTVGTVASGSYQRAALEVGSQADLRCAACPGFVEFVERGETASDQVHVLAERLLSPLREAAVDTLLLGCTHYPFLARTIGDVMGRGVVLVSSADETAFDVRTILESTGLAAPAAPAAPAASRAGDRPASGSHRFLSSGDVGWFVEMGGRLLGPELDCAESIRLGGR